MEFTITAIFNRSVTIERNNKDAYETEVPCRLILNGKMVLETTKNVISLHGLTPDTEYDLVLDTVSDNAPVGHRFKKRFRTKAESILLNVRKYGAVGDGEHNDTAALQAAIMSCPENGTVWLPKGTYLSGPLFFKSHMTFWVDEGATLLGDTDRKNYPILPGIVRNWYHNDEEYNVASWEGNPLDCFASLITAIRVRDLDIIGQGTIDGNAQNGDWWKNPKVKRIAWRPNTVFIAQSKYVRMQGVAVQNSPTWTVHPYYSDHLAFMDLRISNPSDSPNTDGFDPESCEDVLLVGTRISVGDDCIALKSGKLYMARYHHKETRNVIVRNCLLERGHGSVTVGSEVAGGVSSVHVTQCIFSQTDRGVRIKTRRGRGERSVLTDLTFEDIRMDRVHMPVTVNMFYFCDPDGHSDYVQNQEAKPVDYRTPYIGHLKIKDVECTGVDSSFVCVYGLPEAPIGKLTLKRIKVDYLPEAERTAKCPIMMDGFPEMSGKGMFLKNVNELEIEDVRIKGSADTEAEMENVLEKDISGLVYEA
ncbi:MAG: glycoside hydrolase family 28 protein [Lachnospiraceae bacterium]|nr:glycoside hydrolase family 28 protein [Lachnospiraceae bacterium]